MVTSLLRNTFSKLLFFSLLVTCYLLLVTSSVFAQTTSTTTVDYQPINTQFLPPQSPNYATQAIYNFIHASACIMIGQSPMSPCLEYKLYQDTTGALKSVPVLSSANTNHGLLGLSISMVGEVISNPPVRSSEFIANLGQQLGISEAHAQVGGSGSGVLAPIFKLWETSRNIAYLAMIIIFVIVGLMVMFRQKLNPQTVVSVQLALPGLVIGLVMITFSYFLASLISDIAFLGTNIVGYYFYLAGGTGTNVIQLPLLTKADWWGIPFNLSAYDSEANVLNVFGKFTSILSSGKVQEALSSVWPYLDDPNQNLIGLTALKEGSSIDAAEALTIMSQFAVFQLLSPLNTWFGGVGTIINLSISGLTGGIFPLWVTSVGLGFLATIILVYSMFKLLLKLIQNFISIIFLTIAAPFYFLAASLPGKSNLISNWMFNMLCNVLAFPAVFAVFFFVAYILGPTNPNNNLFQIADKATLTGPSTFPLLGGFTLDFLNRLLAFGALVAAPSIPDIICRAVGKPSQFGALAAGVIGGAIGAGQKYQGQATSGLANMAGQGGRLNSTPGYQYFPDSTEAAKAGVTNFKDPGIYPTYDTRFGGQLGNIFKARRSPVYRYLASTRAGKGIESRRDALMDRYDRVRRRPLGSWRGSPVEDKGHEDEA